MPELEAYRKKRDFAKTPEPLPGDPDAAAHNLVFVVQQHAAYRAGMHWDFRLEVDGVLKSWPLRKAPSLDPKQKRGAAMTEDHPYAYREFEGVIPKGEYGGGQVIVWDEGIYTPDEDGVTSWDDKENGSRRMNQGIDAGKVSFTLQGHKLKGSFALIKTKYRPNSWLMIKHRDDAVSERDLSLEDRSVRSGLTIEDLKEGRLPNPAALAVESHAAARAAPFPSGTKLKPMLSTLVDKAFDSPGWLWEPKLDGVRALAYLRDGKVELRSRRGVDITRAYPSLCKVIEALPVQSIVLDGEVCALDEAGVPRFQLLQPRINLTRGADVARMETEQPVVYFAFDLLYLDGYDLTAVPLRDRKLLLESRVTSRDNLHVVSHIEGEGTAVEVGAVSLGFEGVVGKRADSRYEAGQRSRYWLKVKDVKEQEFVVGGWTPGEGGRSKTFGALSLGYYEDGVLRYAGNVGSGFNERELNAIQKRLEELATDESPFAPKSAIEGKPKWVRPEIVIQVKYAEWTKDGRLRAPVFLGVRTDIDPLDVRREVASATADVAADASDVAVASTPRSGSQAASGTVTAAPARNGTGLAADVESVLRQLESPKANIVVEAGGETIKLTNLDKEFWPAHGEAPPLVKRDLIRYYTTVAPYLILHLKDRPLTLTRYPNGIEARPFYQKHYEQPIPRFVETRMIWSEQNRADGEYILCNNLPTLVWLAQLADLEMHAWMARVEPEPDAHGRTTTFSGSEAAVDDSVLNYPDFMVFDLDPYIYSGRETGKEEPEYNHRGWDKTVEIALSLKDLLDQLKLSSYVKTSGKTGIHVYVPILRHYDYDAVRAATATIGRFLIQQHPRDVTMEWDTSKRRGKVFFDHNQNTRGKTLAAQYSLRPTAWAGVSMPVAWSELATLDPTAYNLLSVPQRLAQQGDVWADILSRKNDLEMLLGK
ncbi:MAG TPA: non-homologous end-joining DNA ligase [Dehalococcoidia bacterium]|nr:non-homologous end-joining DNA ligase [Dehalococcoidia bacterium]